MTRCLTMKTALMVMPSSAAAAAADRPSTMTLVNAVHVCSLKSTRINVKARLEQTLVFEFIQVYEGDVILCLQPLALGSGRVAFRRRKSSHWLMVNRRSHARRKPPLCR